jgi:hypothetical protein
VRRFVVREADVGGGYPHPVSVGSGRRERLTGLRVRPLPVGRVIATPLRLLPDKLPPVTFAHAERVQYQPVLRKSHRLGRLRRARPVVLPHEDIHLVDGLGPVETHLQPDGRARPSTAASGSRRSWPEAGRSSWRSRGCRPTRPT